MTASTPALGAGTEVEAVGDGPEVGLVVEDDGVDVVVLGVVVLGVEVLGNR